ncbi:metal ABC transporter ATP-binding protein [Nitrosophilus alvini]|uniref:metal ABC transporter ATP-binding protein n=1 Tax=Nitrosophilus alvini TaxID=2714855 RepID=UPI00190DF485|nr:ABC transporter ATP-binding protein [Nitrosophilus alvini]
MKKPAISVKNLYFKYDKEFVLQDISVDIYENDYIAVIGPNGGGKSTFVKILLGLLKPDRGEVKIYGKKPEYARELIGYLPQMINFNLDLPISVEEVVLQGRLKKGKLFYSKDDRKKTDETLSKMGLTGLKKRKIEELSGGQRQKVLIARALCSEPKILIFDEPTASIDIEGQKEIYKILKELDLTKIVISHDINILFEGVNRVAYINRKIYMHEEVDINLKREGHFCEMELLNHFKSCNAGTV